VGPSTTTRTTRASGATSSSCGASRRSHSPTDERERRSRELRPAPLFLLSAAPGA
jgi:hypothetical protein